MSFFINEERFFEKVLPYIGDKEKVIQEIIENACRAQANNITFTSPLKGVLNVFNDGQIIDNWKSILKVADTGYEQNVVESHKPAGMGMLMVISVAEELEIRSGKHFLSIESEPFFSDEKYRKKLFESLESPALADGFVKGLEMQIKLKKEFFRLTENPFLFLDKCKYYPINISYLGEQTGNEQIEWELLKEGEGKLRGTKIGIPSSYCRGRVIWFGKEIDCQDLAPFVVWVYDKNDFIVPALPDRSHLSSCPQLLKKEIERQLYSSIQKELLNSDGSNKTFGRCPFMLLERLTCSYDVSHFKKWGFDNPVDISLPKDVVLYDDKTEFNSNLIEDFDDVEFFNSKKLIQVSKKIGATEAPEFILGNIADKVEITIDGKKESEWIGLFEANIYDSILVNGKHDNDICIVHNQAFLTESASFIDNDSFIYHLSGTEWSGESIDVDVVYEEVYSFLCLLEKMIPRKKVGDLRIYLSSLFNSSVYDVDDIKISFKNNKLKFKLKGVKKEVNITNY